MNEEEGQADLIVAYPLSGVEAGLVGSLLQAAPPAGSIALSGADVEAVVRVVALAAEEIGVVQGAFVFLIY
jgi:hypothetical protein